MQQLGGKNRNIFNACEKFCRATNAGLALIREFCSSNLDCPQSHSASRRPRQVPIRFPCQDLDFLGELAQQRTTGGKKFSSHRHALDESFGAVLHTSRSSMFRFLYAVVTQSSRRDLGLPRQALQRGNGTLVY